MESNQYPSQTDQDILKKLIVVKHGDLNEANSNLQKILSTEGIGSKNLYPCLQDVHFLFVSLHGLARTKIKDKLSQEDLAKVEEFRKIEIPQLLKRGAMGKAENQKTFATIAKDFLILFDKYQDAMQKAGIGGL